MHLGISHLIIESDCQVIINQILQNGIQTLDIGNLVLDIREWMEKLQDYRLQYSSKWSNSTTHAKSTDGVMLWFRNDPDFIAQIVWMDKHNF